MDYFIASAALLVFLLALNENKGTGWAYIYTLVAIYALFDLFLDIARKVLS